MDLTRTHLKGANLSGANLSGANLSEADLSGANLSEADLSEADLSGADLSGADLSEADLSEADLIGAHLKNCKTDRCQLNENTKIVAETLVKQKQFLESYRRINQDHDRSGYFFKRKNHHFDRVLSESSSVVGTLFFIKRHVDSHQSQWKKVWTLAQQQEDKTVDSHTNRIVQKRFAEHSIFSILRLGGRYKMKHLSQEDKEKRLIL